MGEAIFIRAAFTSVWAPAKQLPDKANCRESITVTSIPNFCYSSIDFLTNTDSEVDLYYIASLVTPDHHFAQDASTTWHSCLYFHPYTGSHSLVPRAHYLRFKLPHLRVLRPWDYCELCMRQRVHKGESYIFYLGYLYAMGL